MAATFPFFFYPALDTSLAIMSGAKLYFYDAGTTTPKSVYTDAALAVPHASPVVADANGRFAAIYLAPATAYRATLKTSAGATIADLDNYTSPSIALPTFTNIGGAPADNAAMVTALALKANLASPTFTGTPAAPTAAAATSTTQIATTAFVNTGYAALSGAAFTGNVTTTGNLGFATGAGGTVTQATSKATGVTLNKPCGQITLNNAALAAATIVSFVLTNTAIAATDIIVLNHISGGTPGSYTLNARAAAGSATIDIRNNTAGSLSEAIVIGYTVIKAVAA